MLRLMIVDDEPDLVTALEAILRIHFEVLTATTDPPAQGGDFGLLASGLSIPGMTHMGVVSEGVRLRSYLIRESSWFAGPGTLGHFSQ